MLSGAVVLVITVVGWASLRANRTLTTFDFGSDPGPVLIPGLLLWGLGAGGLVLVLQGTWRLVRWRGPRARRRAGFTPPSRLLLPALFVVSLALYVRVLTFTGFPLATLIFCAAWILILTREPERRRTAREVGLPVVAAALITAAIYYVFKGFVKVPLP